MPELDPQILREKLMMAFSTVLDSVFEEGEEEEKLSDSVEEAGEIIEDEFVEGQRTMQKVSGNSPFLAEILKRKL